MDLFADGVLFVNSLLWDGTPGSTGDTCCNPTGTGPWFHTTLITVTADDIEVRVCENHYTNDEFRHSVGAGRYLYTCDDFVTNANTNCRYKNVHIFGGDIFHCIIISSAG